MHIMARPSAKTFSSTDLRGEPREGAVNMRNCNSFGWSDLRDATVSTWGNRPEDCTSTENIRLNRNFDGTDPFYKFVHATVFVFVTAV